jgi:hypothetical protein
LHGQVPLQGVPGRGNRAAPRCPRCGTHRLTKLKERDRIDKMETGFLNLLERLMNGQLYHCRFCRIQFFDRRKYSPGGNEAAPAPAPTVERSTATSGY